MFLKKVFFSWKINETKMLSQKISVMIWVHHFQIFHREETMVNLIHLLEQLIH